MIEAKVGMHENLRQRRQLDQLAKSLLVLVGILLATTFVAYWPEMTRGLLADRFAAGPKVEQPRYFLFRLPREAMLVVVLSFVGYFALFSRRRYLTPGIVRGITIAALGVLLCVGYTIVAKDLPVVVPLLGLRMLQYTPLVLAGYVLAREYERTPLLRFASYLRIYVAIVLTIAMVQLVWSNPTSGRPRAIGAFASFNTFGATLVACSLWFLLAQKLGNGTVRGMRSYLPWVGACLGGAVATGSRTAIALCAAVTAYACFPRLERKKQLLLLVAIPILIGGVLLIAANPLLSGRPEVMSSNSTRVRIYLDVIEALDTPADLVLGGGVGLYSSSTVTLLGRDRFPGQAGGAHSSFLEILGGFGLGGLLAYCYFFWASARTGPRPHVWLFLLVVGLLSLMQPLWGMFPADVLLLFLWGHLVGIGKHADSPDESLRGRP